jgi:hypothetical protein
MAPFPLLDLPFELRLMIYHRALADSGPISLAFPSRQATGRRGPKVETNLLLACRQIYQEASDVLYDANVFDVGMRHMLPATPGTVTVTGTGSAAAAAAAAARAHRGEAITARLAPRIRHARWFIRGDLHVHPEILLDGEKCVHLYYTEVVSVAKMAGWLSGVTLAPPSPPPSPSPLPAQQEQQEQQQQKKQHRPRRTIEIIMSVPLFRPDKQAVIMTDFDHSRLRRPDFVYDKPLLSACGWKPDGGGWYDDTEAGERRENIMEHQVAKHNKSVVKSDTILHGDTVDALAWAIKDLDSEGYSISLKLQYINALFTDEVLREEDLTGVLRDKLAEVTGQ